MPRHYIVVDRESDVPWLATGAEIMTARKYVALGGRNGNGVTRVINLCSDDEYLGMGYYCSLLAEARGHRVIPSVEAMLDLHWKRLLRIGLPQANDLVAKALKDRPEETATNRTVTVFFGVVEDRRLAGIGRRLFELFRCPALSIGLAYRQGRWQIADIGTLSVRQLNDVQRTQFAEALEAYTRRAWRKPRTGPSARYTIAILYDPAEKLPPSDAEALRRFQRAGAKLGADVELITRDDYTRLLEYDALFIRETTAIDHHTYRFAKKAEAEGIAVIDDPQSILRCTNKIYLAELLQSNGVPTPKTLIIDRNDLGRVALEIGFPAVLKVPDGSFSRGVLKVESAAELAQVTAAMFKDSELIVAQEFMATNFDWRIGVLAGKPLYACQYLMARGHWQIVKHIGAGQAVQGGWRTFALDAVPSQVLQVATRAASLVGQGLYGVDLKETDRGAFVVEVNDNPNLESGVEDGVLKDALYEAIMADLIRRIESRPPIRL
jgi:glutathione synthase/RimK-type ligase-like ATP-grasp enzyme